MSRRPRYEQLNSDLPDWAQELQQPFNRFTILDNELAGSFGVVYRGNFNSYRDDKDEVNIAMKTITEDYDGGEESLLREGELLSRIGYHYNVLHLLAVTQEPTNNGGRLFLVFHGRYNGTLLERLEGIAENEENYRKQKNLQEKYVKRNTRMLIIWCSFVAHGVAYLAKQRIIIGNLRAEHVHVTDQLNAKIGYFGPSFQELGNDESKKEVKIRSTITPTDIKYLPPEAIMIPRNAPEDTPPPLTASLMTDVWQWGILVWQIFSLGEEPYKDKPWVNGTYDEVLAGCRYEYKEGDRLEKPERCETVFFDNILRPCLIKSPEYRPSWDTTVDMVDMMVTDNEKKFNEQLMRISKRDFKNYTKLFERTQMHRSGICHSLRNCWYSATCHCC